MSRYLIFDHVAQSGSGKTEVWAVVSRKHGTVLGLIKWYGPWRGYAFFPKAMSLYNGECLLDIEKYLGQANKAHKAKGGQDGQD